jgi:hypothetical protein
MGAFHEPGLDRGRLGRFGRIHYPCAWVTSKAGKMPAVRFMGREHVRNATGNSPPSPLFVCPNSSAQHPIRICLEGFLGEVLIFGLER